MTLQENLNNIPMEQLRQLDYLLSQWYTAKCFFKIMAEFNKDPNYPLKEKDLMIANIEKKINYKRYDKYGLVSFYDYVRSAFEQRSLFAFELKRRDKLNEEDFQRRNQKEEKWWEKD